ncbi:MAG: ATP-binding protein [Bacteroidota bacterium]
MNLSELLSAKESEDRIEFKEARNTYSFEGGDSTDYKKRRRSILGYVVALANEGGGKLILGIRESSSMHTVVGTKVMEGATGQLEEKIYNKKGIRVKCSELFDTDGKRVLVIDIPSRPIGRVYTFEDISLIA